MSILRISVLLLIFCAAACKNPIDKSESQMSAGLSVPPGHPGRQSAVAIAEIHENGVGILCSGVLVAENLVVTAAHCIGGKEPKQLRVFFGEDANSGIFRPVTATRTFRQNNELGGRRYYPNFDIAWMRIGGTLPAGASPTPILFDAKTLGQGTLSSIVGVAATNTDESRALGVKFAADLIVERHLDHPLAQGLIIYAPRSGSVATCGNETGGPAYVKVQGEWFVAGINNGTPQHFVKSEPGGCREGVQTALSHYKGWIETSAGVDLAGPTKSAKAEAWPTEVPNHMAFKDWCEDPNLPERFWFFCRSLPAA